MRTATIAELIAALQALGLKHHHSPVKVWLPGSTLSLEASAAWNAKHGAVLIEGNIDPGSALEEPAFSAEPGDDVFP